MPLTLHLKDKDSPVRRFLRDQFPNVRAFLVKPRRNLRKAYTICQESCNNYPWSTVGVALDYRIRYYFGVTPCEELVAYKGARDLSFVQILDASERHLSALRTGDTITVIDELQGQRIGIYYPKDNSAVSFDKSVSTLEIMEIGRKATGGSSDIFVDGIPPLGMQFRDYFCQLNALTKRSSPVAKRLPRTEEDELNRHCFALALLEETARTGKTDGVPLADGSIDVESLLGLVKPQWVDDLTELSWEFYDGFNDLLAKPCVLNPKFEGSRDIGGADGDLIVDGTLIEIKTTTQLKIDGDWIRQLLGYVLLDYSDAHRISDIGLYMSRQGMLITWELEEVLRGLYSGEPPKIGVLRNQFKEVLLESAR